MSLGRFLKDRCVWHLHALSSSAVLLLSLAAISTCSQPRERANPYDPMATNWSANIVFSNFVLTLNPILTNTASQFQVAAYSPKAEALFYDFTLLSGGGALDGPADPSNKTFKAPAIPGVSTVQLLLRSTSGLSAVKTLNVTVTDDPAAVRTNSVTNAPGGSGQAPVISAFTAPTNALPKGTSLPLVVVASDPDGGALTYAFAIVGGGGILGGTDGATGKIYNAPASNAAGGPATLRVTVSKAGGKSASRDLVLNVDKSWITLGSPGISVAGVASVSMALDFAGNPYVAYGDSNAAIQGALTVRAWNGAWNDVGGTGVTPNAVSNTSIAWNPAINGPFVAYADVATTFANARQYNGSWNPVGASFGTGAASSISAAFYGSVPHVFFRDSSSLKGRVFSNAGSWGEIIAGPATPNDVISGSLAIDATGAPYVAFKDTSLLTIGCAKWSAGNWNLLGSTTNISSGTASIPSVAIDPIGNPVVAFQDMVAVAGKASAMAFSGTWNFLAAKGFTALLVNTVSTAINGFGDVYVASDGTSGNLASVMVFKAGSWQAVGSSNISPAQATEITLKLTPSGDPVVCFRDASVGYRPTVMTWR
ncbi:MAG: hypothetical protein J0L75_13650 [Spirochaetes bacterium]|nr:hypothetical protein [Spirochaetota bacterium]